MTASVTTSSCCCLDGELNVAEPEPIGDVGEASLLSRRWPEASPSAAALAAAATSDAKDVFEPARNDESLDAVGNGS